MLYLKNLYNKRKCQMKKDYEHKIAEFIIRYMQKFEINNINIDVNKNIKHKYSVTIQDSTNDKQSKSNYYI